MKEVIINTQDNENNSPYSVPPTNASILGEMVWLMSQTPIYRQLKIADLEWLVMPPLLLKQFKLFYGDNNQPVGFALWANLSEKGEEKFKKIGKIDAQDWANDVHMDKALGLASEIGGTPWLIELVAPFHTDANKQRDLMLADLMGSVFKDKLLKFRHINPQNNVVEEIALRGKAISESSH